MKLLTLTLLLVNIVNRSSVTSAPPPLTPEPTANLEQHDYDAYQTEPVHSNPPTWSAVFGNSSQQHNFTMSMFETQTLELMITGIDASWGDDFDLHVLAEDTSVLRINQIIRATDIPAHSTKWVGNFSVEALLLGRSSIYVELRRPNLEPERAPQEFNVIVMRKIGIWDTIFRVTVAGFVMILYINFGAALDLDALKGILLCPVGPTIGFFGQFCIMPITSFLIGYYLFPDMIEMRLGLFFAGTTPGGGSSNIFTVILGGNLNLSITMTALSNLAAFAMMPLWIFTLGAIIFRDGNFVIPYMTIAMMSFSLIVPLSIGICLQKYSQKIANYMVRILKPLSLTFIVFITVFAFTVNFYMFKLFTWKIIVAGSALPWIGYTVAYFIALLLRQSYKDALTIAIETGIQNTGIAIFMLNFSLPHHQADMTTVVPVASSLMTPIPLILLYVILKIFRRSSIEEVEPAPTKEAQVNEIKTIMNKAQVNPVPVRDD